jgi:hypothetical protein
MTKLISRFHYSVLVIVLGGVFFIGTHLLYCIEVIKSGKIWFLTVFVGTVIVESLVLWLATVEFSRKAAFFDKRSVKRSIESFFVILGLLILGLFIGTIYTKSFLYETIKWLFLSLVSISQLWMGLMIYRDFKSSLEGSKPSQ